MHEGASVGFRVLMGGSGCLVITVAVEDDLHVPAAMAAHLRLFHLRCGPGHENGCLAVQDAGCQGHALGVVAG